MMTRKHEIEADSGWLSKGLSSWINPATGRGSALGPGLKRYLGTPRSWYPALTLFLYGKGLNQLLLSGHEL